MSTMSTTSPHTTSPAVDVLDPTEQSILDAALATVLSVGIRHTTLTEVARRAGVSRMTAYRRFGDADTLLRALMTREFSRLLEGVLATSTGSPNHGEQLVTLLVAAVRELPEHPLMRKMLDLDVSLLGPYVVDHLGSTQLTARDAIRALVEAAREERSISVADAETTTLLLLLTTQSLVLSRKILRDSGRDAQALSAWEAFLRGALGMAP